MNIKGKFAKLIRDPRRYLPLIPRLVQERISPLFQNTAFFMQGQMDIHPRARWHSFAVVAATGGFFPPGIHSRRIYDLEAHDNTRRDMLALMLRTVIANGVEGAFAELGVYQGRTAKLIHHYAPERRLHLFDTFAGFTDRSVTAEARAVNFKVISKEFANTSLEMARNVIAPQNENVFFHPGFFPDSIPDFLRDERFAFVHLDADLHDVTLEGLRFFYPRISRRGMLIIHDYNAWPGARKAVDDFFADKSELPIPMPDKSGSALVVKQ